MSSTTEVDKRSKDRDVEMVDVSVIPTDENSPSTKGTVSEGLNVEDGLDEGTVNCPGQVNWLSASSVSPLAVIV